MTTDSFVQGNVKKQLKKFDLLIYLISSFVVYRVIPVDIHVNVKIIVVISERIDNHYRHLV